MNIFYTQVDANLQTELNARANASTIRTVDALNYIISKVANIELRAYEGPGPIIDENSAIDILGGSEVRKPEYTAAGQDGFLNPEYVYPKPGIVGSEKPNTQLRIPPFISSADIQIGDNSMGLLNTANVVIEIPNAERDLDYIEEIYMRPGRYVKLTFIHDASSIVSTKTTQGLLTTNVIPTDEKLKSLYPSVDLEFKKTDIRKMNQVVFEGLITNFNFSYQKDFSVQLQLSLRGTSNVFTDVSMFIDAQGSENVKLTTDPVADPDSYTATLTQDTGSVGGRTSITEALYKEIEEEYAESCKRQQETLSLLTRPLTRLISSQQNFRSQLTIQNRLDKRQQSTATDHFFLIGEAWSQTSTDNKASSTFQRYVTLGYLIDFINRKILAKQKSDTYKNYLDKKFKRTIESSGTNPFTNKKSQSIFNNRNLTINPDLSIINPDKIFAESRLNIIENSAEFVATTYPEIIHSDTFCYSNYYENLCSTIPTEILLLPADSKRGTTEKYGNKIFYEKTYSVNGDWEGFTGLGVNTDKFYPSRIFINIETIDDILYSLGVSFKVSDFLAQVSLKVYQATSGAISLKLITHPEYQTLLAWYDENYLGTPKEKENVKEYTVPMSAGFTVVHDFQLKAQLPDNVSSLSYVLNQNPENISSEDIAPYINYMYNSNNPTKKAQAKAFHETKYKTYLEVFNKAKEKFAGSFTDPKLSEALDLAQKNYLQYPVLELEKAIKQIAPIIPFEISFTIDGINGFRYGDVLTFNVLPEKYRINTVFSVVAVNHQVTQEGAWTTEIRCIMRPKIG